MGKQTVFQIDNTLKHERQKEIAFWNLYALNNVNSISEMIKHHRDPKMYTTKDQDWRDLYFLNKNYKKGQEIQQTFIQRSQKYISDFLNTMDRVSWLKKEYYDLKIIKHQFWTKVWKQAPRTKQQEQSRKMVRDIIWGQRMTVFPMMVAFTIIFNYITGISGLSITRRLGVLFGCAIMAQIALKFMRSDTIFYAIPPLPDRTYEKQRKKILNQCIFFDGAIIKYNAPDQLDVTLVNLINEKETEQEKEYILKALKIKPIKESNLV